MTIKMIVATGMNFEIGVDDKLLWHLPEDMKYFKKQTEYCNVVMGNSTFESLNLKEGLKNRKNITLTNKELPKNERIVYQQNPKYYTYFTKVTNLEDFFDERMTIKNNTWIIGGSQIYEQFVELVDEIHWTVVFKGYPEANKFLSKKTIEVMQTEFYFDRKVKSCYDEKSDTHFSINVLKRINTK